MNRQTVRKHLKTERGPNPLKQQEFQMYKLNEQSMKEMSMRRKVRNLRAQLHAAEAELALELERVSLETQQELPKSEQTDTDPLVPQIMVHELSKSWAPASYYFSVFAGSKV